MGISFQYGAETLMHSIKTNWIFHLLGWLLFISLPLTIISRDPDQGIILTVLGSGSFWLFVLIYCLLFYTNLLYWVPQFFLKKKYVLYAAISVTALLAIYFTQPFETLIFSKFHQEQNIRPEPPGFPGPPDGRMPGFEPERQPMRRNQPVLDFVSLVLFVMIWVIAMFIRISGQLRISEKQIILSEADKAQAQLSFFKAQINPHFLFNTLNNIYSMAVSQSVHTAPSILKLSAMMRYITEEATENYVPLEDEITCLQNYIALQQLRLSEKTTVTLHFDEPARDVRISPLVLMTFVENAFKYGVSNSRPSEIMITLRTLENMILFECKNQIMNPAAVTGREGVGIANTRKRLEFLYADRYNLTIQDTEGTFFVRLKLYANEMHRD